MAGRPQRWKSEQKTGDCSGQKKTGRSMTVLKRAMLSVLGAARRGRAVSREPGGDEGEVGRERAS